MECFKIIASHMLKGLMYHREMEDYMRFLGFEKLAKQQREQYIKESNDFADIHEKYFDLTGKLLKITIPSYEQLIPDNWYSYNFKDVDNNTRQKYLRSILELWLKWEEETLTLYEDAINTCRMEKHEQAVLIIDKYLKEVSEEILEIETLWTQFEIYDWQPHRILMGYKEE